MGGNALKHTNIRRYRKEEYFKLYKEIESIVPLSWEPRLLQAYRDKDDFGDMDLLVCKEGIEGNIVDRLRELFNPTDIVPNSNVISLDYKELQIDFIVTPKEEMEVAYNFFAWNDLGNFIGKIAHQFGLKYGFAGLRYVYRSKDESRILGEIVLSKDPSVILPFLGFDYERWLEGFDTMEQVFDYVIHSKYFNPKLFQWDQLSSLHKKRNKRRPMYHAFLEYVEEQTFEVYERKTHKENYFKFIQDSFSHFNTEVNLYMVAEEKRTAGKVKFTGTRASEIYNLTGPDLGRAMKNFANSFESKDAMIEWIYVASKKTIWRMFEITNETAGNKLDRKYIEND